jgi:hypothetical protein
MAKAYFIPNGPKNLKDLFTAIDFSLLTEYYVEVMDADDNVVATSALNKIGGCCEQDQIRLHFLNYLGGVDAINFKLQHQDHESKADEKINPTSYPLNKPDHGAGRLNVKSNDSFIALTKRYKEEDKDWLDELFDSPLAWMEWSGVQGQDDSYIPVIILDKKFAKVEEDDRFIYEVTIEFKLSHERFIIRN